MGVISLSSLKGGVGKTSLAVNVAHSFARRGCRTLLVDLDPSAHASRFFVPHVANDHGAHASIGEASLARALLSEGADVTKKFAANLFPEVRPDLDMLPASPELRHLLSTRGSTVLVKLFGPLVASLRDDYDHIVFDTPPDFNILTRNALAVSDIALIPVDASEMSIHGLEGLITSARHIKRPIWTIARTMVNKKAARTNALSSARLHERLVVSTTHDTDMTGRREFDVEDPNDFMEMLRDWEKNNRRAQADRSTRDDRPIYLLRALIHRTETQNQLSFVRKTALDTKTTAVLADEYLRVASELEDLLAAKENEPSLAVEPASSLAFLGEKQNGEDGQESEDALDYADRSLSHAA